jgi:hypothetical protein
MGLIYRRSRRLGRLSRINYGTGGTSASYGRPYGIKAARAAGMPELQKAAA